MRRGEGGIIFPMEPVTVEHLHLMRGTLVARVRVSPKAHRTNAALAARVAADFPNLPLHSCVNDKGPAFASVMEDTSVPHLLEHLIIDGQVAEEPPGSCATFAGHTTWLDEANGVAQVTVRFRSDACALRALERARSYLNGLMAG